MNTRLHFFEVATNDNFMEILSKLLLIDEIRHIQKVNKQVNGNHFVVQSQGMTIEKK